MPNEHPDTNPESLDLATTVMLEHPKGPNPKKKNLYHALYASQLYGSFFSIFGRFESKAIDDDTLELESVNLILFNYKGLLNMGFFENKDSGFWEEPGQPNAPVEKSIIVALQGGSGCVEKRLPIPQSKLIVKRNTPTRLILRRKLHPLKNFAAMPANASATTSVGTPPDQKTELFDTEFHYRDGINHYYEEVREGMVGGGTARTFHPGLGCMFANINLYF
jgi:hypothetical protein